jgi:hypothetical protein
MSENPPPRSPGRHGPVDPTAVPGVAATRRQRRREKIVAEIQRNRRGEYKVPTWVLTAALVLVVGAWVWLVFVNP